MACAFPSISEFLLLVDQVVHSGTVIKLFVFDALDNVIVVISVQILQLLSFLSVDDDLGGVQRVQV